MVISLITLVANIFRILASPRMDESILKEWIYHNARRRFRIKIGGFARHFLIRIRHILINSGLTGFRKKTNCCSPVITCFHRFLTVVS